MIKKAFTESQILSVIALLFNECNICYQAKEIEKCYEKTNDASIHIIHLPSNA